MVYKATGKTTFMYTYMKGKLSLNRIVIVRLPYSLLACLSKALPLVLSLFTAGQYTFVFDHRCPPSPDRFVRLSNNTRNQYSCLSRLHAEVLSEHVAEKNSQALKIVLT